MNWDIFFLHLAENSITEFVTLEEKERADKYEREADKFASDSLIPETIWEKAPAVKLNQYQIQKKYTEWTNNLQLNKWIVLGRLTMNRLLEIQRRRNQKNIVNCCHSNGLRIEKHLR